MSMNRLKTVILLGALTGVFLLIGSYWGYGGMTIAIIFALVMNVGSYWFSDKIVLKIYRAKEVKDNDSPKLFKLVREVADRAGIPMPRVYIIPAENMNAFAVGRDYTHSAVAFTQGILQALDKEELEGVIAHEISHIKNRDTLIQTIAATIAGVISYVAFMARWAAIFGGFGGDRDNDGILGFLVLAILAPLIATIIHLALSRSREYLADESAAKTLHNSKGLASALNKLEASAKLQPFRFGNKTTSSLFIVNPFRGQAFFQLFSTHPATEARVKKLNEMKF